MKIHSTTSFSRFSFLSWAMGNWKSINWIPQIYRYGRLLKPKYGDGLSSPPRSITGQELPSALEVSQKMFGAINVPDRQFTLFNVPFGQFTAHDMSNGNGSPTLSNVKLFLPKCPFKFSIISVVCVFRKTKNRMLHRWWTLSNCKPKTYVLSDQNTEK